MLLVICCGLSMVKHKGTKSLNCLFKLLKVLRQHEVAISIVSCRHVAHFCGRSGIGHCLESLPGKEKKTRANKWIHQRRKAEAEIVSRDTKRYSASVRVLLIVAKDWWRKTGRLCSHFVLLTPSASHLFQMLSLY